VCPDQKESAGMERAKVEKVQHHPVRPLQETSSSHVS
jgi:hypothetical protein